MWRKIDTNQIKSTLTHRILQKSKELAFVPLKKLEPQEWVWNGKYTYTYDIQCAG